MSIALYCEVLGNLSAKRVDDLNATIPNGIECVYVNVWPDYAPPVENHPKANRISFAFWRERAGVPVWAWINCKADQAADAATIAQIDATLDPDGYLLDIEGEWVKGANLTTVVSAAAATGKPVRASLAGTSASHVDYDFQTLDKLGVAVEWQAYFDSGEGESPAISVSELHMSSFVIEGWKYRHRIGSAYGWGQVVGPFFGDAARFDSFKLPRKPDTWFYTNPRSWGREVADDRTLYALPRTPRTPRGLLMGRAAYSRIRVALDVTRGADAKHTLSEWTAIAASARSRNAARRPIAVYLAEVCPDDVLAAIAKGAA